MKNKRGRPKSNIPELTRRSLSCKKYEKTLKGFLMRTYRNMKSRVLGIQKKKSHLYLGLQLLSKEQFYEFSLQSADYNLLYNNWVNSGYDRKLSPSIDRIDPTKGYIQGNMRWITHSQNSAETRRWQS